MRRLGRLLVLTVMTLFTGLVIAIAALILMRPEPETPAPAPESSEARLIDWRLDEAVMIAVGADIQATIEQHPPGSVFIIGEGVHRVQRISPRDGDVFIGAPGAILNGSRLLTGFEAQGDYWLLRGQTDDRWTTGECLPDFPRCNHAYDLFLDDQPLLQVASVDDLEPNTWFFDYDSDTIYLAADPSNRVVELSSQSTAFDSDADDVLIYGLIVEKYAGPGQRGAIRALNGDNWRIERNIIRLNSGGGVTVGNGTQVVDNQVVRNGQIGVSGIGENILVESNEIAHNNFAGYDAGWEAGGTKFVTSRNVILRDNYVHHNRGPGLWADGSNVDVIFEHNLVVGNAGSGIFHEISYDAVIRHNVVMYNAATPRRMFEGAQIIVSSSSNTEVHDNTVVVSANGGNAIVIVQQERSAGLLGEHFSTGNEIHNNTIVVLHQNGETGVAVDQDNEAFWQQADNRFRANTYYVLDDSFRNWGWRDSARNWQEWQRLGLDEGGSVSTDIPLYLTLVPAWRR